MIFAGNPPRTSTNSSCFETAGATKRLYAIRREVFPMMGGVGYSTNTDGESHERALEQKRQSVKEILVTAILFGLSLNILSDVLLSLPELTTDPLFFWKASLGTCALVLTLLLFWYLLSIYLTDYRTLESQFKIALVWDITKRGLADCIPNYFPHYLLRELIKGQSVQELFENDEVGTSPERVSESGVPLDAVEAVMLTVLHTTTQMIQTTDGVGNKTERSIESIIGSNNVFLSDTSSRRLTLPGKCKLSYARSDGKLELKFRWRSGPLRSLEIKSELGRVDWYDYKLGQERSITDSFYEREFSESLQATMTEAAQSMPGMEVPDARPKVPQQSATSLVRTDFLTQVSVRFSRPGLVFSRASTEAVHWAQSIVERLGFLLSWDTYRWTLLTGSVPPFR